MFLAFGFGSPPEWIILFIIALIVLGPNKMPEVGKQLGKALRDFRKLTAEFTEATHSIHEDIASATGSVRGEVESAYQSAAQHGTPGVPVEKTVSKTYDDVDDDPMAQSSRLSTGTASVTGLKLSTAPETIAPPGPESKG